MRIRGFQSYVLWGVSLLVAVTLVACAGAAPPASQPQAAAPAAGGPAEEIKLGLVLPTTGAPGYGLPGQRVTQMTVEQWNNEGGILVGGKRYKVVPIIEDGKYTGPGSQAAAEKLVSQDKVKYLIAFGSTPATVVSPFLNEQKVVEFGMGSSTETIISAKKPYIFNSLVGRSMLELPQWIWAHDELNVKSAAYFYANDDAGKAGIELIHKWWPILGIKSAGEFPVERDAQDFYSMLTKANAANPDFMYFTGSPQQSALFAKQSYELKTQAKRAVISASAREMYEIAGTGADGVYMIIGIPTKGPAATNELTQFATDYTKRWGSWDTLVDQYLATLWAWRTGLEKAGTIDPDKVIQVLPTTTPAHLLGPSRWVGKELWGEDHQIIFPVAISQLQGGDSSAVKLFTSDYLNQSYQRQLSGK